MGASEEDVNALLKEAHGNYIQLGQAMDIKLRKMEEELKLQKKMAAISAHSSAIQTALAASTNQATVNLSAMSAAIGSFMKGRINLQTQTKE